MAVPTDVLWERDPHTAAKHTLLRRYLSAWFPIMTSTFRSSGVTFLDGFAGPGEYTDSTESSPTIAMEQAVRPDVVKNQADTRLLLIEDDKRRARHLDQLLQGRFPTSERPHKMSVLVKHGKCAELFDAELAEIGGWKGPIFANLDGWGADTHYDVVRRIAQQPSSEVLVTFKDQFFTRFAEFEEQQAGDRVFGGRHWRDVAKQPTPNKKPYLLSLYRDGLQTAGFAYILSFEMIDEGGHSLYLFFGTTSVTAVEKFKDGLWEVDGVAGQKFRDPRNPGQLSFDMQHPDFTPLANEFLALLEAGPRDLEMLSSHALLQTLYKRTHAKTAVERLLNNQRVVQIGNGRTHKERVYALAPPKLF